MPLVDCDFDWLEDFYLVSEATQLTWQIQPLSLQVIQRIGRLEGDIEVIIFFGFQVVTVDDVVGSDVTGSEEPCGGVSEWSWSAMLMEMASPTRGAQRCSDHEVMVSYIDGDGVTDSGSLVMFSPSGLGR